MTFRPAAFASHRAQLVARAFRCSGKGGLLTGFLLLIGGMLLLPPASAQGVEGALTRQNVRDYIRLRVDIHQKQQKMKANADQYEDVINAFFQWQSEFLQKQGWTRKSFEALEKRIMSAERALEMVADSAEYRAQQEQQLKAVEMSKHMTEEEKETIRAEYAKQDSIRNARHIDPTRRDWPAVRPYEDALEHLVDYVALNRSDPPKLENLPPASE